MCNTHEKMLGFTTVEGKKHKVTIRDISHLQIDENRWQEYRAARTLVYYS